MESFLSSFFVSKKKLDDKPKQIPKPPPTPKLTPTPKQTSKPIPIIRKKSFSQQTDDIQLDIKNEVIKNEVIKNEVIKNEVISPQEDNIKQLDQIYSS